MSFITDVTKDYNDKEFEQETKERYDSIEYDCIIESLDEGLTTLDELTEAQRLLIGEPLFKMEDLIS